mgnify:CR=1 FL=1
MACEAAGRHRRARRPPVFPVLAGRRHALCVIVPNRAAPIRGERPTTSFHQGTRRDPHAENHFALHAPSCTGGQRAGLWRRWRCPATVLAQGKRHPDRARLQQDRPARGLRQSRPQTGFTMGLDYATGGTMTVAGRKLGRDREGRPGQARRRQEPARARPTATTRPTSPSARRRRAWRWRCCRWPRSTRRSCWSSRRWPTRSPATSGTSTSSAPAATSSQDAISNAVALDKAGRLDRHAGAGLRVRPRRREGVQGLDQEAPRSSTRSTCRQRPPTSPPARSG